VTAATPGQVAYEAFWTRGGHRPVVTPWAEITPSEREKWEADAAAHPQLEARLLESFEAWMEPRFDRDGYGWDDMCDAFGAGARTQAAIEHADEAAAVGADATPSTGETGLLDWAATLLASSQPVPEVPSGDWHAGFGRWRDAYTGAVPLPLNTAAFTPASGAVAVRAYSGGVIALLVAGGASEEHVSKMRDSLAAASDVPVAVFRDLLALLYWQPSSVQQKPRRRWRTGGQEEKVDSDTAAQAAIAAQQPQGESPSIANSYALYKFAQSGEWLTCEEDGRLDMRKELLAVKAAVRDALKPVTGTPAAAELLGKVYGIVFEAGLTLETRNERLVDLLLASALGHDTPAQPAPELAAKPMPRVDRARAEADELRAVIDMIWRMCQKPKEAAGLSRGLVVNGEHLADRIAGLIKNSGLEPF
jgi:hypothetical protein